MTSFILTIRMRSQSVLDNVREKLKDIVDSIQEVNNIGEAQEYILKVFDEGFKEFQTKTIPKSVEHTISNIDCEHLKHDHDEGFLCFEGYSKNKKYKLLDEDADEVIDKCYQCRVDRAYQIQLQYAKRLRMQNINEFNNSIYNLLKEIQEGKAPVKFYHCYVKNYSVSISVDQEKMNCPKLGYHVSIKDHCQFTGCEALNLFSIQGISEVRQKTKESIEKIVEDFNVHTPSLPSPKDVSSEIIDDEE